MTFAPLWSQAFPIPLHAVAALLAIVIGALQFCLPKGRTLHRILGWSWVILMAIVAISGLFIHNLRLIGPFSPIHLLSIVTLISLVFLVRFARRGETRSHRGNAIRLYILALIVTGAFTLAPGRVMNAVVFGPAKGSSPAP